MKNIADFKAIVFPDGRLEEGELNNVFLLFDVIHVGIPVLLQASPSMRLCMDMGLVNTHKPVLPKDIENRLGKYLGELRLWLNTNRDSSFSAFLKAFIDTESMEEVRWKISEKIKEPGKNLNQAEEKAQLRNQILLHLYQEAERERKEAQGALTRVESLPSPLAEALGNEDGGDLSQGPTLNEMPGIDFGLSYIPEVLNAWLETFSGVLGNFRCVLTTNEHVFRYVTDFFEEATNKNLMAAKDLVSHTILLPDLSGVQLKEILNWKMQEGLESTRLFHEKLIKYLEKAKGPHSEEMELGQLHMGNLVDRLGSSQSTIKVAFLPELTKPASGREKLWASLGGKVLVHLGI